MFSQGLFSFRDEKAQKQLSGKSLNSSCNQTDKLWLSEAFKRWSTPQFNDKQTPEQCFPVKEIKAIEFKFLLALFVQLYQGHWVNLSVSSVVQDGQTYCRRRPCDCGDPDEDLFCCPGCDNRPSSQCLDQSGRTLYRSGASWLYGCQQCRCMVCTQKHTHLHRSYMCLLKRHENWLL